MRVSRNFDGDPQLLGGPRLPHYLEQVPDLGSDYFDNRSLRVGEVKELIYPDDERSVSKQVIEYRVAVQHLDEEMLSATTREYAHCVTCNVFGGLADKVVWTYRPGEGETDDTGLGKGSKVLLLCINGIQDSAVILGGVRDERDKEDSTAKERGHHFYAVFNGCTIVATKEGDFSFLRRGATDIDGKTLDSVPKDAQESGLTLFANGSIVLGAANKRGGTPDQYFGVDQPARKAIIKAGAGLHIGDATDEMALFATYRRAESQFNNTLVTLLTQAQNMLATMGTALSTTAALHVIPIVGPILAAPAIGQISVQVQALVAIIAAAVSAINTFEGGAASYLSAHNRND